MITRLSTSSFKWQVKDKEAELKSAEQKLHDEFERLRRQNAEEKRQLDDKKRQLVSSSDNAKSSRVLQLPVSDISGGGDKFV